jgi:hypothetical protein
MACRASRAGAYAALHSDVRIHTVEGEEGGPLRVTERGGGQGAVADLDVQPRGEAEEPPQRVPDWPQADGQGSNAS